MRPSLYVCVVLLVTAALSAACSPRYDWRELQPSEDPLAMMLPAKPAVMSRMINLDGTAVKMRMHGALVDGHSFTAAWLALDETDLDDQEKKTARDKGLAAMQKGMVSNIDGAIVAKTQRTVGLIDASGRPVGKVPATELTVKGTGAGKPVIMHAVFASFNNLLYQFVVLGQDTPTEQIKTYLDSVRIRIGKPVAVAAGQ